MDIAFWHVTGVAAAILTMFGFVPQIQKTLKTHSVDDVSLPMLIQCSMGAILWAAYGAHRGEYILIISNVITLATLIIAIGLYFKYRARGPLRPL
jgi:MtN3 and saliva related transmembrane protein